jgi:hypothetical protein
MKQHDIQSMQDEYAVRTTSVAGATIDALNKLEQAFTDTADMVRGLVINSLNTFNDGLMAVMTGRGNVSMRQVGAYIFGGAAKVGLQGFEGQVLKMFGFGGKSTMGTPGNPMHVVIDGGAGMPGAAAAGGLAGKLGGWLGKLFGHGGGVSGELANVAMDSSLDGITIPGFATGGPIPANLPSIVGERGPELFMPSTPGRIVPNHQLGGVGGQTVWNIDARGTDPSLTMANVHHAVQMAYSAAYVNSQHAMADRARRRPR